MPVDIIMPELGESVHEVTVTRWLKKVGDFVKEDEPVVEIMTDKVNTELQAPAAGTLVSIAVPEGGETVVFSVLGVIEPDEAAAKAAIAASGGGGEAVAPAKEEVRAEIPTAEPEKVESTPAESGNGERKFYSPVVRAMAKEHGISEAQLSGIAGSGGGGRVTKKDLEGFIAGRGSAPVASTPTVPTQKMEVKEVAPTQAGPDQEIIPLVGMRKMIADAMVRSSQVPVVSTLTEVDVTKMVEFRTANKETFPQMYGVKLTYTPFFIKALAETLMEFPMLNSALMPDNKIIKNNGVHMGVAVSLGEKGDGGLIVPVMRDCHKKNLIEIAKDLEAIAGKARKNALGIDDVQGGTFTLTNPGSYGAVLGTPMINAPQAGILGTYGIIPRVVAVDGMIAIRSIMNLVLTYDHRLVDGATAGKFLFTLKGRLEKFDFFK
jgi:pyruvate/2-oxoglutarate dehydrogenase complex dihydrolipoamide acyltransferase (E2) component